VSIPDELRAARSADDWRAAHAPELAWELRQTRNGTPLFRVPIASPWEVAVFPRRGLWVLAINDGSLGDGAPVDDFEIERLDAAPSDFFARCVTQLLDIARAAFVAHDNRAAVAFGNAGFRASGILRTGERGRFGLVLGESYARLRRWNEAAFYLSDALAVVGGELDHEPRMRLSADVRRAIALAPDPEWTPEHAVGSDG
jgi:hypothetical protein